MRRIALIFGLIFCLLPAAASAQTNSACQFVLGFQTLHDMDAADIGDCVNNQYLGNPNGDQWQNTTKGLMVWRKADNWTAFTNGHQTWLNGPAGLVVRLNTQRFSWEADAGAPGTTLVSAPTQAPAAPTAIGASCPGMSAPPGYTLNAACQLVTPSGALSQEAPSSSTVPAGATGHCNDGTYSFAANHRGMCSSHGGVAQFYS